METFTKRKPTEEMFTENWSLKQWVKASYPGAVMETIDETLLNGEEETKVSHKICLLSVIELALDCSRERPEERINMKEVAVRLKKIKQRLLEATKLPS